MEVRQKHLDREVEHKFLQRQVHFQVSLLRRWHQRARKRFRLKYIFVQTSEKASQWFLRRCYNDWKAKWARQLLFHERECKVSAKKNFALVELKVKELEDKSRQKQALDKELSEVKDVLAKVEKAHAMKTVEVAEQSKAIQARIEEVKKLEEALKQSQLALKDAEEERKRLRLIEEVYEHDQELIKQRQQAMQEEASKVLQSLEASTEELRQEATHAKSFVEQAKEQAQRSLHDEEESLQEVLSRSSSLKQRVTQKAQEVQEVEAERDSVLQAIAKVKERLGQVNSRSFQESSDSNSNSDSDSPLRSSTGSGYMFDGIESDIRHKESEIQTLRLKTGQTEARVSSLRQAIANRKAYMNEAIHKDEEREYYRESNMMQSLQDEHSHYYQSARYPESRFPPEEQSSVHTDSSFRLSDLSSPRPASSKLKCNTPLVPFSRSRVDDEDNDSGGSKSSGDDYVSSSRMKKSSEDINRAVQSINERIRARLI